MEEIQTPISNYFSVTNQDSTPKQISQKTDIHISSPEYLSITKLRELRDTTTNTASIINKEKFTKEKDTENKKVNFNIQGKLANSIIRAGEMKERENPIYKEVEKNSSPSIYTQDKNRIQEMHLPQLNQEKKKSIKYEWDEVILDPPSWEQSKIVLSYLIQNYNVELPNDEIRKDWQQDLESKNLTSLLEEKPIIFPSKMRSLKKIEKEINILYGEGDKRRLRPGEEAAIIQQIDNMILDFQNHPDYIKLSLTSDIKFLNLLLEAIDKILFLSKFKELSNYPFCRKQVELHYRIMMTKFRCSDYYLENVKTFKRHILAIEDKILIDLNSETILSEYLIKRIIKRDQSIESYVNTNNTIARPKTIVLKK